MEVSDLQKIAKLINDFGMKVGLWNSFSQLKNSITQYTQTIQSNPSSVAQYNYSNIESQNLLLIGQLNQLNAELESLREVKIFHKLKLNEIFGIEVIDFLSSINIKNPLYINDIIRKLTEITNKAIQFQNLFNSLNNVLTTEIIDEIDVYNKFILYFENGANIETLKELSKASNDWQIVVNCLSRLVRDNENETKIISVERGSVILTVTAISAIIYALANASNKILDVILKVYEVKKSALQLKQLKLTTIDDAISLLEKQAKLNVVSEASTIANELLQEFNWSDSEELFNETKIAVNQAIRKIIRFTNAGGKIETHMISPTENEKNLTKQLKLKTKKFIEAEKEVFKLEGKKEILQLEDKTENEEDSILNKTGS